MERDNDGPRKPPGGNDFVVAAADRSTRPAYLTTVMDGSGSMLDRSRSGVVKFELLKAAYECVRAMGREDKNLAAHGQAAFVGFPGPAVDTVDVLLDFTPMASLPPLSLPQPQMLGSPGGRGVVQGLDMLDQKCAEARAGGSNPRCPVLVLVTDGMLTDDEAVLRKAGARVRAMLEDEALSFAILFIEDEDAAMQAEALALLEKTFGVKPLVFEAAHLPAMFSWVTKKLAKVAAGGKFDQPQTGNAPLG